MAGPVDLVLGGGGVRGVAIVGALAALDDAGWKPYRVAGASAGAMAGALAVAGATPDQMREYLHDLDYRGFAFSDVMARLAKRPVVGSVIERLSSSAVDPLVWYDGLLATHDVRTWADLALPPDECEGIPPAQRYKLVVRCLDVVHRRVVRLPWDYHRYGLVADEQSVAEAVRASMSVPLVFDPVPIGDGPGRGLLVDGGIGSAFPVTMFDRTDAQPPRRPTFAVRLVPKSRTNGWPDGDFALMRAVLDTILEAGDQLEPITDCDEDRTVRVDASGVAFLDVRMTAQDEHELFTAGVTAVQAFLTSYDDAAWSARCR